MGSYSFQVLARLGSGLFVGCQKIQVLVFSQIFGSGSFLDLILFRIQFKIKVVWVQVASVLRFKVLFILGLFLVFLSGGFWY